MSLNEWRVQTLEESLEGKPMVTFVVDNTCHPKD